MRFQPIPEPQTKCHTYC